MKHVRRKYSKPIDSELSKADLANRDLVEDQFSRDLDFWELRLQQQWYNLWNRYTMEESDELWVPLRKFYIFRILPFNPIIRLSYAFNLFRIASVTPLLSPLPHKSQFQSYFGFNFASLMRAWKSYISLIVICAKLWNSISIHTRSCVCLNRPASRSTG